MSDNEPTTPTAGDNAGVRAPTDKEALIFFHVLNNMNVKIDTDWSKVAAAVGYKDTNVVRTRFGQIMKSLGAVTSTPGATTPGVDLPKTKPKASSKVAVASESSSASKAWKTINDDHASPVAKVTKPRGRPRKNPLADPAPKAEVKKSKRKEKVVDNASNEDVFHEASSELVANEPPTKKIKVGASKKVKVAVSTEKGKDEASTDKIVNDTATEVAEDQVKNKA